MIDFKLQAATVLTVANFAPVYYWSPPSDANVPCVTYYEADHRGAAWADNSRTAEVAVIVVDVWARDSTSNMANKVDVAMIANGWLLDFCADIPPQDGVQQKSMRFINARGK